MGDIDEIEKMNIDNLEKINEPVNPNDDEMILNRSPDNSNRRTKNLNIEEIFHINPLEDISEDNL